MQNKSIREIVIKFKVLDGVRQKFLYLHKLSLIPILSTIFIFPSCSSQNRVVNDKVIPPALTPPPPPESLIDANAYSIDCNPYHGFDGLWCYAVCPDKGAVVKCYIDFVFLPAESKQWPCTKNGEYYQYQISSSCLIVPVASIRNCVYYSGNNPKAPLPFTPDSNVSC